MTARLALFDAVLLACVILVAASILVPTQHHSHTAEPGVDMDGTARAVVACLDAVAARIERR